MNGSSDNDPQAFLRLFVTHQPGIFAYILSLVPHWSDAEEILQETSVVLWRSFGDFTIGTNFKSWALTVAHNQVLAFLKRNKRTPVTLADIQTA